MGRKRKLRGLATRLSLLYFASSASTYRKIAAERIDIASMKNEGDWRVVKLIALGFLAVALAGCDWWCGNTTTADS